MSGRGDDLAQRDDDRDVPPVTYQAIPFRPTGTAIRDELGRSMVKAGVSLLPGIAFGTTFALVAWKAMNALRNFIRGRRYGTEPEIAVRVFNRRSVVDVGHVVPEETKETEETEAYVEPRRARPQDEKRKLQSAERGKAKEGLSPPEPSPPKPVGTATRRARYLRRRAGVE